jgi:hypothetical protein
MGQETYEPVGFDDVTPGDRVRFVTADNGFGGTGELWREGTVTSVTLRTVRISCDSNLVGPTAVLRRSTWPYRSVSRTH